MFDFCTIVDGQNGSLVTINNRFGPLGSVIPYVLYFVYCMS